MDILIKESTGTYHLDVVGTIGGRYFGDFVFKAYLTPMELISCDREFRDLIGKIQTQVDPTIEFLAFALTQLKYRTISSPLFWKRNPELIPGGDIPDQNVIEILLEAAKETEKQYKETLIEQHENSLKILQKQLDKEKNDLKVNKEFEPKNESK